MEKFKSFLSDNLVLIIIVGIILLLAIVALIVLLSLKKKGKPRLKIDDAFIDNLLALLGQNTNINNVNVDNGRLKITVNDLDIVNLQGLKEISETGVFVTGNTIKVLFKLDSITIKKALDKRI